MDLQNNRTEQRSVIKSLNSAVDGFIYVVRTQRNMRLHFLIATLVLIFGIYINLPKHDLLILLGSISLVLALEMVNMVTELTLDMMKSTYHPSIRIIKDVAAGAVFLASFNAIVVGYIIFTKSFALYTVSGINKILHSSWHLTFIALLAVLFLVVCGKVFFHKGTPFRGGMPSGHAAFAFSMWTVIAFTTKSALIILLSFSMAFMISRHRVKDDVHSLWEVIVGALVGVVVTALVFQLLIII